MPVEFRLLGEVEVVVDGHRVPAGHARQRCVLAALLIDINHVVLVDQLVDRVWQDAPPGHVRATLAGYVSRLRNLLSGAGVRLAHESGGYRLSADPMSVDMHRFRRLVAQARAEAGPDADVHAYEEALGLWRGEAFAGIDSLWFASIRDALATGRLAAELDRNDVALRHGRHAELVGELTLRAAAFPWDERVVGQLMVALYRSGRQADALASYHDLQHRLDDDLGAYPSPPLQELHKQILNGDPALDVAPEPSARVIPQQLPSAVAAFVGRRAELKRLDTIAAGTAQRSAGAAIAVVSGTVGDLCNEAEVLYHLGDTHLARDDRDAACRAWRHSASIFDTIGHPAAREIRARLRGIDGRPRLEAARPSR